MLESKSSCTICATPFLVRIINTHQWMDSLTVATSYYKSRTNMIETLTPILLDNQQCPPHSRQHSTWPSICTHGPINQWTCGVFFVNGHVSFAGLRTWKESMETEHPVPSWYSLRSCPMQSHLVCRVQVRWCPLNYDLCRIGELRMLRLQLRLTATLPRKLLHWASLDLRFCLGTIAATTWLCGCKGTRISRYAWDEVAINNIQ